LNKIKESKAGGKDQEKSKPQEPFRMSMKKEKIKMTLSTAKPTTKPNTAVLEKLGMAQEDLAEAKKAQKRKAELEKVEAAKKAKNDSMALMDTLKERLKNKIEAGKVSEEKAVVAAAAAAAAGDSPAAKMKKPKKEGDSKGRREELLKQLKAVEDAIHRKRTKLDG